MSEPSFVNTTRIAYDLVAAHYAALLHDELANSPCDRAILGAFAELVTDSCLDQVGDVGCGPGWVTDHLHSLGLPAVGIDLSPEMVAVTRRKYPELRFEVGSMTNLDLPDGSLGGVVAWYSIIHIPPKMLPSVFAQFSRVHLPSTVGPGTDVSREVRAGVHPGSFGPPDLPLRSMRAELAPAWINIAGMDELDDFCPTGPKAANLIHACDVDPCETRAQSGR